MISYQFKSALTIKLLSLAIIFCGFWEEALSQASGTVIDSLDGQPAAGASLLMIGTQWGSTVDSLGHFDLPQLEIPTKVRVSCTGYVTQELMLAPGQNTRIALAPTMQSGLEISANRNSFSYANTSYRMETVDRRFLQSIPANNNLMETMDYVNGMRQQVNCGVCGTNDIHINGMEGPYTLVLIDGMPIISALASVYGLNGIPQSMIERIEIVKGPATAMYGAEAMGGVVNIVTRNPDLMPDLSISSYGTSHGELNTDVGMRFKRGRITSLLSGNYYHMQRRIDFNSDNFTDIPLSRRGSAFNKWTLIRQQGRIAHLALKYYGEDRFGGELQWLPIHRGTTIVYGEAIQTQRMEALATYQLPLKEYVRLDLSAAQHFQNSYYGSSHFKAQQFTGYAALLWLKEKARHKLQAGSTLRINNYQDNTPATALAADRSLLPGIFVEDEIALTAKFSVLLGGRLDHHPSHGLIATPRLNLRWKPSRFTNLRLTAGRGFRAVNLFTEEHAALTGARQVVIEGKLAPERSNNVNLNFNQVLNIGASAATLDIDAFYTHFDNRILPDYETHPNQIIFRNLEGQAELRGISIKWSQSFKFPLKADFGGTWMTSLIKAPDSPKQSQLLTPVFQGVFNLSYEFKQLHSQLSYTGKVVGPMALPSYAPPFERPTRSDWYTEQNLQITTDLGKAWSVQLGCRNLFNFTQSSPLIDPSNPFGDNFDTAYAYGSLQTRRFVLGLAWKMLDQKS